MFSNVKIETPETQNPTNVRSRVTIYDLKSKSTKVLYTVDHLVEAPNWSPDRQVPADQYGWTALPVAGEGQASATRGGESGLGVSLQ